MSRKIVIAVLCCVIIVNSCNGFRIINIDGEDTILAEEDEKVKIKCEADVPMAYCLFEPPKGKRFSFTGNGLIDGQCSLTIEATKQHAGQWKCHIGKRTVGVETVKTINVRVSNKLAAVRPKIVVQKNEEVILYCASTDGRTPLSYCRFESPRELAFSIDSEVTKEKAILKKYYFPANKSLDRGDCAVAIKKVSAEDDGRWMCGAGLDDEVKEYTDLIDITVEGIKITTASATGITFGVIAVVGLVVVAAYLAWRNRGQFNGHGNAPETVEQHELGDISRTPPNPRASPFRVSPKLSAKVSPESSTSPKTPEPGRKTVLTVESHGEPGTSPLMGDR